MTKITNVVANTKTVIVVVIIKKKNSMNRYLGAPIIKTERLYCRLVDLCDVKDMYEICSNQEVTKYLTFEPHTNYRHTKRVITNMIRSYLDDVSINYVLILNENKKVIGSMSVTFLNNNVGEIGYLMNKSYWNKGYMSEAIKALINVCFEYYHLNLLIVRYISQNKNSEKLIKKMGFKFDYINYSSINKNGILYDVISNSLSKYDYENQKKYF